MVIRVGQYQRTPTTNAEPAIETYLKTDFAKFVFANSITLTPGTITMLIRGDVVHVHTMSQFLEDDLLEGAIERKVAEVFEPEVLKNR